MTRWPRSRATASSGLSTRIAVETTTTELSKAHRPDGFEESRIVARRGGKVAGDARRAIEADTGRPAVTAENAAQLNAVVTDMIEGVAGADKPNGDEK